jgi:CRISPR-associated protein Cas2
MFILLTYDISLKTESGQKRLRQMAKICEGYGVRVQNSVFEMEIDAAEMVKLKMEINTVIEGDDSVRLYKLGKNYKRDVTIMGHKNTIEISNSDALML